MSYAEFGGCLLLAFGPALAMFLFTIAHDPIRIIIIIAAAFFWMLSVLISSLLWFVVIPLREHLAFGLVFSVCFQEIARFGVYKILRKAEKGLQEVTENTRVIENKHILAYVAGLGFGIISGIFALDNVLADMWGPATMGLNGNNELFFITSAAQTLSIILLHTFWSVIFFNALDLGNYLHIAFVVASHLLVSCVTLVNEKQYYSYTLTQSYLLTIITGAIAFNVVGGSFLSFKRFITCK